MTGIIFKDLEHEKFSILKFYVARANRIIPALAVLCLVLMIFGWFYLTPFDYKLLGKHAASSMTFYPISVTGRNPVILRQVLTKSGYYIPGHFRRMAILYDLSARSHCHAQVHVHPDHEICAAGRNNFRIHSINNRYLSMAKPSLFPVTYQSLGNDDRGIAYLYPLTLQENKKRLLEGTGLVLILGSYFFISAEDLWPGYLAVFPVIGTFLMIQSHRNDSVITNNIVFQN